MIIVESSCVDAERRVGETRCWFVRRAKHTMRYPTVAVGCGYLCHISAALFYSILFCPFCAALLYKHVCFTATEAGSGESWSSDAVPFVVLADWFVRLPTGVTTCRTRTRSSADSTRSFLLFRQFSILSSL